MEKSTLRQSSFKAGFHGLFVKVGRLFAGTGKAVAIGQIIARLGAE